MKMEKNITMNHFIKTKANLKHEDVCEEFKENYLYRGDNEDYGFAFHYENGNYYAGYSEALKYCPACGKKL